MNNISYIIYIEILKMTNMNMIDLSYRIYDILVLTQSTNLKEIKIHENYFN